MRPANVQGGFSRAEAETLVGLCAVPFRTMTASAGGNRALRVVAYRDLVYLRCPFSPARDLVVRVGKGRNRQINFANTRLISLSAGMSEKELNSGTLTHGNGDDSTPWNINGTYIGTNCGCSHPRLNARQTEDIRAPNRKLLCAATLVDSRLNSPYD